MEERSADMSEDGKWKDSSPGYRTIEDVAPDMTITWKISSALFSLLVL